MDPKKTLAQLNSVVQHCRNAPFYYNRLPGEPLQSLEQFRNIPFITKEDLRLHSPYGLLCVPRTELFQYHESFGTTGAPVSVWLTWEDYRINAEELSGWGVNFDCNDIVMVRFPYSISAIAHTVTTAAQMRGACVVPVGARSKVSPFPRVINLLQKLKVTVLACLPLQALLIAETAELMGLCPGKDFPDLRAICTAGETLAPGRRKTLEDIWGVPVFDNYGLTEVGAAVVDCRYQRPHPLDDYFYFEILREDLKTVTEYGETGFLAITTLKRQGMPLVRYLTGDLARRIHGRCPCGAEVSLEIRGRAQHIIKLKDRTLDLWDIENLVSQLPCKRFWIAAPDNEQIKIIVEEETMAEAVTFIRAREAIEKNLGIKLSVALVPKGTLYDREELLAIGEVGKPQYIYTAQEMAEQKYVKSARV
jgi:phenylacetate-CoA ligase